MTRTDGAVARLRAAIAHIQHGLKELGEVERDAPAEVERAVSMLVAHLRSWRPESVSPLGVLGAPTETIRDPRRQVGPR